MSSGVAVNDAVIEAFEAIKMKHTHKFVLFKLSDDLSEIVVDATSSDADYANFLALLPPADCRYALYDIEYDTNDGGKRAKLVFIVWCPDDAPIKSKMLYAASKDAIKKKLNGIQEEMQATDWDEVDYDCILKKVSAGGTK